MGLLTYSESLVGQTAENVNKLNTMLSEILASVNSITNAQIADLAGIAYEKLTLTNKVRNADVKSDAAIELSKLNITGNITSAMIGDDAVGASELARPVQYQVAPGGGGVVLDTGAWEAIMATAVLPAGVYLVDVNLQLQAGTEYIGASFTFASGFTVIGDTKRISTRYPGATPAWPVQMGGVIEMNGTDPLAVWGQSPALFPVTVEAPDSTLNAWRLSA